MIGRFADDIRGAPERSGAPSSCSTLLFILGINPRYTLSFGFRRRRGTVGAGDRSASRDRGDEGRDEAAMTKDKQYLGIEALRFLCAFAVVVWHYQHFYMGLDEVYVVPFTREMQPLHGLLKPFYGWGYMAVSIFWQISGFIFFWKYHEAIAAGRIDGFGFFVLRFSRLYPLHVATLVLVAGLQIAFAAGHGGDAFVYGHDDLRHLLLGLAFASSWGFEAGTSFNGPVWSVSIEVLVYALFFAISTRMRLDLLGRIGLVALAVGGWVVNERWGTPCLRLLIQCAAFFFAGGVVHAALRMVPRAWVHMAAGPALVAAVVVGMLFFRNGVDTSKFTLLTVSTLLLVGFVGLEEFAPIAHAFERIAPAADMTYSSYLLHFPIQLAMVTITDRLGWARTVYDRPMMLVLFLGLTFGLARVVHHGFERPAQQGLRRLLFARRGRAAAV